MYNRSSMSCNFYGRKELMIDVSKPTTNPLLIVNVILLWTLHDYNGLGVMSSISSSCTF